MNIQIILTSKQLKRKVMKTERKFRKLMDLSLLMFLLVAVILIVALSSCGKNKSPAAVQTDMAPPPLPPPAPAVQESDPVYNEVDEMPEFPEGENGLLKYIASNARYPEEAKKKNITGKVIVKFVVEKDCSVSKVEVMKGIDPLLDAEAVRVVNSLPKFEKPAKKDGVVVSVYYMVPITFALK